MRLGLKKWSEKSSDGHRATYDYILCLSLKRRDKHSYEKNIRNQLTGIIGPAVDVTLGRLIVSLVRRLGWLRVSCFTPFVSPFGLVKEGVKQELKILIVEFTGRTGAHHSARTRFSMRNKSWRSHPI